MTGPTTVTLVREDASGNSGIATVEGAIALDTIDVSGGAGAAGEAADRPYQTPGSFSHISLEQIDRVPPISPGDIFVNTPGVINAGNRVGTSINPNIRGLQGMGRVNTTIDGARQTSSSYRGYIGSRDETYIDPDMIGGIDIAKGPSEGVGGIGGSVAVRTLLPDDIVKDGHKWGARLKGSLGNNTSAPEVGARVGDERRAFFDGDMWSGSLALATVQENFEAVAAPSKRRQGNYFTGTHAAKGVVFPPGIDVDGGGLVTGAPFGPDLPANAVVPPGGEAMNTSEDTESALIKGKVKWGDGQSLQLGYLRYASKYGEIDELFFAPWIAQTQLPLTTTRVDTYTANHRWKPSGNNLVNLRTNLWFSDIDVDRGSNGIDERDHGMGTTGGDVGNTATFETAVGKLSVDSGLEFVREHATSLQTYSFGIWGSFGPSGIRLMTSAYANAKLELTNWLSVSAGERYDHYKSEGEGYLADYPERSGSRASPNAGVTLTPLKGFQVFAQYKEGYRPPSLRESHWNYGSLLVNNPNLDPERSTSYELGFNLLKDSVFKDGDKLRFKAAYFDNRYDDYIVRAPVKATARRTSSPTSITPTTRALSFPDPTTPGCTSSKAPSQYTVEYCPAGTPCFTPHTAGFAGSTDPLKNDYVTNYIPPEYSGSLTAGIRLFDETLTLGGRIHFASTRIGSSWDDTAGQQGQVGYQFTWPSYTTFDVFGSYRLTEDSILNFSVQNITDEYYFGALSSVGIASPGRIGEPHAQVLRQRVHDSVRGKDQTSARQDDA